jgi:uncharacterized protein YxjI
MQTLYLPKNKSQSRIDMKTFDSAFNPKYHVVGKTGHKGDVIFIYDLNNNELARIRQITTGIIPRFQILHNDNYVASFGLSVGRISDIIYISHLNWIITGEISTGKYRIRAGRKRILNVLPVELADGSFNQLDVALENQEAVHVGIVTILDTWSNIKKHNSSWNLNPKNRVKYQLAFKNFSKRD